MRNQKGRKLSLIVAFVCPAALLQEIDEAVATQAKRTRKTPLNRSSWIQRAIRRDLDHRERSRTKRPSLQYFFPATPFDII